MRRALFLALPVAAAAAPVAAQTMDPNMPGMKMAGKSPQKAAAKKSKAKPASDRTGAGKPGARKRSGRTTISGPAKPAGQAMSGMKGMTMSQPSGGARPMPGMGSGQSMQGHDMSAMPGMNMGQSSAGAQPMPGMSSEKSMQGQDLSAMPGMNMGQSMPGMKMDGSMPGMSMGGQPMPGMDMSGVKQMPAGATKPLAGDAPPPPKPIDHAADGVYGPDAMSSSRGALRTEQGGQTFSMVLLNLAEYQFRNGRDGYRWDGEAWYGGDVNRLWLKSEGEGTIGRGVETAEAQALYSRAIGPYWNLQGGVRYDFRPNPQRAYATVGIEGLAPNNFEVEGALFLSTKGDLLGRLEGWYDQRITQRLILQPRVEFNLAAQDVPETRVGSGLSNAELGLRLRYEIRREFAPYIGVSWERQVGDTARFYRAAGDDVSSTSFVAGVRFWF